MQAKPGPSRKRNAPLGSQKGRCFFADCRPSGDLHRFFHHSSLCTANCLDPFHAPFHRRFREERALLELLQHARPLVLLLETPNRTIDRFILTNDDTYQMNHLPRMAGSCVSKLCRNDLRDFGFN